LETDAQNSEQRKIVLQKINQAQLTVRERLELRTFYWAAFFGMQDYVRVMLVVLRWSPFLKSFKKRSILSGAIIGRQVEMASVIIEQFYYDVDLKSSPLRPKDLRREDVFKVFGKDSDDNNILHHCYIAEMPEVRKMIRNCYI